MEKGKGKGRPKYKPTPEDRAKVGRMASMGLPQYQIAMIMDIADKTLRKNYKVELTKTAAETNLQVVETLFQLATSGKSPGASIFWAKTRCGFRNDGRVGEDAPVEKKAVVKEPRYLTEAPAAGGVLILDRNGEVIP